MTSFMTRIRAAMERRRRYNRTAREIARLPLDVALDLNLYRGDAHRIARQAVYGAGMAPHGPFRGA